MTDPLHPSIAALSAAKAAELWGPGAESKLGVQEGVWLFPHAPLPAGHWIGATVEIAFDAGYRQRWQWCFRTRARERDALPPPPANAAVPPAVESPAKHSGGAARAVAAAKAATSAATPYASGDTSVARQYRAVFQSGVPAVDAWYDARRRRRPSDPVAAGKGGVSAARHTVRLAAPTCRRQCQRAVPPVCGSPNGEWEAAL